MNSTRIPGMEVLAGVDENREEKMAAMPRTYQMLLYITVALVLAGLMIGSALAEMPDVMAAESSAGLEWLKAAGFPTWAFVLLYLGQKVIHQIQALSDRLHEHVELAERRLARLEALQEAQSRS